MKKNKKPTQNQNQKNSKLTLLKNQLEEANIQKLRALADYQNLQKRLEKEKQDWIKYANGNLLNRIIDIQNDLFRAQTFIKDSGLDMVIGNINKILKDFSVAEIEAEGKEFNPETMDCVDYKKGKKNQVLKVTEKGYKLYDKVLRPAKVVVGK